MSTGHFEAELHPVVLTAVTASTHMFATIHIKQAFVNATSDGVESCAQKQPSCATQGSARSTSTSTNSIAQQHSRNEQGTQKAAAAAARGETVSSRIDTGFFLVTPSTSGVYKKMVGIN